MQPRQATPARRPERFRRHRPDMMLIVFMCILIMLGLIIIYAISPPLIARLSAGGQDLDPNHFMYRQLTYLLVGVAAFTASYFISADWWRKTANKLLVGALVIGVLPFVLQATPIGLCSNDACRWLNLGVVSFQPAEAMKFALVIFLASFLARRLEKGTLNDASHTLWPIVGILLATAVVVIGFQRDLGTGVTVIAIVMTMLFMAGLSKRFLTIIITGSIVLGALFTIIAPHRIERILTFINHPSTQSEAEGYHINQALIAVGSGGLTGKGLGQSIQAFGYLPEAANDSIFAIVAEIFGFLGTLAVLAVFAGFFVRLKGVMDHSTVTYYRLIVAGVFGWVVSHTIINIGAMLGIFPLTGITLPFVSFGGSSLLFMLLALGLVFQLSRYTSHQLPNDDKTGGIIGNEDRRRGRWIGRARHPSPGRFS